MKGRPTGRAGRPAALCQATLRGCGEGAESTEPRLYVLSARRPPDSLAALLSGGDRKRAGPTAPPHGLVLLDEVFCRATPTRALQQSLPLSPTTSKVRAAIWSLAIGVLAVALAGSSPAWCRCPVPCWSCCSPSAAEPSRSARR